MNILLTDVRSLTLDIQEIPVMGEANAGSFSRLLQTHFPGSNEIRDQVAEFKGFLESTPTPMIDAEMLSPGSAAASWREFLGQDQIKITTERDPVIPAPLTLSSVLVNQAQVTHSGGFGETDKSPAAGRLLPLGGNLLPNNSLIDVAGFGIGPGTSDTAQAAAGAVTEATVPNSIGTVLVPAAEKSIAPSTADVAATTVLTPLGNNGMPNSETTRHEAGRGSSQPTAPLSTLVGKLASDISGSGPTGLPREFVAGADNAASKPSGMAGLKLSIPDRDARQIIASALDPDSKSTAIIGSKPSAAFASDISPAPGNAAADVMSTKVNRPALESVLAREVLTSREDHGSVDSREAFKPLQPGIKLNPETHLPEPVSHRSVDSPLQTFINTSQPVVAGGISTTPAVSTSPGSAPSIPNVLPAQLGLMSLAPSADSTEWGNGLSERVNWMINQKQNMATIRLDPPALGKLDVQVKIADDVTTITIQTQHAQTRDLIEAASTRLRDFLQESGYQNVNVDVSQRQDQQQARSHAPADAPTEQQDDSSQDQTSELQQEQVTYASGDGLVDTFA